MSWKQSLLVCASLVTVLVACSAPQGPSPVADQARPAASGSSSAPKRITAAIMGQPASMSSSLTNPPGTVGSVPGIDALGELLQAGLSTLDDQGISRPLLAESIPSADNGQWSVESDGHMTTTWSIRDGARWHDGAAFTTADLVFTLAVLRDRDVPFVHSGSLDLIESAEALDDRTIKVTWSAPFIEADTLFGSLLATPLPEHLLAGSYADDKAHFGDMPFWSQQFVGTGPFRLQEWVEGSHVTLAANDGFLLGRPKIDSIEVRFIEDGNTLISNILAGTVGLTLGRGLDIEQSLQIRDQLPNAQILYAPGGWVPIYPQFLNPSPAVIENVAFRRALLQAINRQEITDTINHGLVPVADSFVSPSEHDYPGIAGSIVRYNYDPRTATQAIADLGYTMGSDGFFRDAAGQQLAVEIRTTAQREHHLKSIYPVADYWQQVGVAVSTLVVPLQQISDREYRANFPGFELVGGSSGHISSDIKKYLSSSAPTADNGFRVAGNNARYMNPDFDALINRYLTTIPHDERIAALGQILHQQTDLVTVMGLFYQLRPAVVAAPITRVTAGDQSGDNAWNAYEWDLQS